MAEPFSFTIRRVHQASEAELEQAEDLLGGAFKNSPFTRVVTANDVDFYGMFYVSTIIATQLAGEVYFAEKARDDDEGKEIVGLAVWFPPGRVMYDSQEQREKALGILMGRFKPDLQQWWATVFLPEYEKLTAYQLGEGTKLHAWHLQCFATIPRYQRKGVGRALIEVIKQRAYKEGKALCVETDSTLNVEIYEKLGFSPQKEPVTIDGLTGSFQMWSLLSEPEAAVGDNAT